MNPSSEIHRASISRSASLNDTLSHKNCGGEVHWDVRLEKLVCNKCNQSTRMTLSYLPRKAWILLGALGLYTVFVIGRFFWTFHGNLSLDKAHWGQFGDYVGGLLNPVFSLAALLAALYALRFNAYSLQISADAVNDAKKAQEEQTITETQTNCIKMHELWLSKHMQVCRNCASVFLVRNKNEQDNKQPPTKRFYGLVEQERESIEVICHFLRDLAVLFRQGLIERNLAISLFKEDVEYWTELIKLFEFEDATERCKTPALKAQEVFRE